MTERARHNLRFLCRYPLAVLMIPIGVALGVCGLLHHWYRARFVERRETSNQ